MNVDNQNAGRVKESSLSGSGGAVHQPNKMTSVELAQMTGKNHKDLMRDIRKMEPAWQKINGRKFALVDYTDAKGEKRPMYRLTKTESLYVATKFNNEVRAKLVLRWEELEHKNAQDDLQRKLASGELKLTVAELHGAYGSKYKRVPPKYEPKGTVWSHTKFNKESGDSFTVVTAQIGDELWLHAGEFLRGVGFVIQPSDIEGQIRSIPYHLTRMLSPFGKGYKRNFIHSSVTSDYLFDVNHCQIVDRMAVKCIENPAYLLDIMNDVCRIKEEGLRTRIADKLMRYGKH